MTAAYLVIYEGAPREDAEGWLDYYLLEHVPLLWGFPDLRRVDVHVGHDEGDVFLMTRLLFDDLDRLRAAITSPQRLVARRDMDENILPGFEGRVRHQVTEVHTLVPPI